MNYTVALIILEFFIAFMFYPIKIGAKGHASLARNRLELDLSLLGLRVARCRIKKHDGKYAVEINGKRPDSNKKIAPSAIINTIKQYRIEGIRTRGNVLALIATDDAKNTAIAYALLMGLLQPVSRNAKIYAAQPSDTFEIDGNVRIRINFLQIVGLIATAMNG